MIKFEFESQLGFNVEPIIILHSMNLRTILLTASITLSAALSAQEFNCYGILAGKDATVDGSVLLGHNEDDPGEQMLNVYMVPADAANGTARYLWAEFPGMEASDSFMNEYGVCVVSDSCPSKEDVEDYSDGGILYNVRVDVAKYARTAREAVEIIGQRVEKFGYTGSGRTYIVADQNEGWFVSVVRGRHWVARRIADDEVAIIPNFYVIDKVDLSDTADFMGSHDIIDYAIQRGWYNPETDGEFSFRKAYGAEKTFASPRNYIRHQSVLNYFTNSDYPYSDDTFPVALVLKDKVSVQNIMEALSLHKDGDAEGKHPANVCYETTVLSSVFQLRSDRTPDKGCIMWLAPTKPCAQAYIPWYLGMTKIPDGFSRYTTAAEAQEKHFSDAENLRTNYPEGLYFKYVDAWNALSEDYSGRIAGVTESRNALQAKVFKKQARLDKWIRRLPAGWASGLMDRFTSKWVRKTVEN